MFKVYLVDDEAAVREGLRVTIPWERCGYTLVGSANDGEKALPEIHRLKPDVLITDIRMPFMDGLALSRQVRREMPRTKIIIISACDQFDCARQAIQIGVEQYLLKPITKDSLVKALSEVKNKIETEQKLQNYYEQLRRETKEQQKYSYFRFFEKLVSGCRSAQEIYEEAGNLHIDINAQSYNIILYAFRSKENKGSAALNRAQDELTQFFLLHPKCLLFQWNFGTCAVIVKDSADMIDRTTQFCIENICRRCGNIGREDGWYVSAGTPVERLSSLHICYSEVSRKLAYSYLCPWQHILTDESVANLFPQDEERKLYSADTSKISPDAVQKFLKTGSKAETEPFVSAYLDSLGADALDSALLCQYIALTFRFSVISFVKATDFPMEKLSEELELLQPLNQIRGRSAVEAYIRSLLEGALEMRKKESGGKHYALVKQAVAYMEQHYTDEDTSLSKTAKALNISACYFSSMFSQTMGKTFIEYLTEKRMELAKELLSKTDKPLGEISREIGYKDPHYFSLLFKKTQKCTPRAYRAENKVILSSRG